MQVLAIIPARVGSKGIPRKNLHPFLGKPLIYWSILAAQESTLIDRILVSTEDPEIAAIASELGAEVPFLRPASLATDDATDYPVIRDCVEKLETNDLERDLFETRKKIEKIARDSQLKEFYICSFSSRSIVYKGMFLAEMLSEFYPDLNDKKLTSRFAVFHQR